MELDSQKLPLYMKELNFNLTVNFPEFNWNMSPALKHQIGGPEGFLSWTTFLENRYYMIKLKRNLVLYTSFGINIYDTFNEFK